MLRIVVWLAVAGAAVVGAACGNPAHDRSVRIAAASDLAQAFGEVGKEYAAKTGIAPTFDFGSSGLLAQQIANGAPYSLFAAASREYVDQVVGSGQCDRQSITPYARGRIVVWTPAGTPPPARLADLADPRFKRVAIANFDRAPYGKAAKQALDRSDLWGKLESKIVLGESVQATMQSAQSRTVDAAIVAQSLAVVADGGAVYVIDPALYDPLEQALVVCGTGDGADAARLFVAYLESSAGREIMQRYGFVAPQAPAP